MTTPESVRNTIISEIEDSIQKGQVFHRDSCKNAEVSCIFLLCNMNSISQDSSSGQAAEADRDFAVSAFALEKVLKRGLDARFAFVDVHVSS